MPITLVTGPANAGKAQVVLEELRRHIAHGAEPILVVPTRADAEHYLRELAGERAAMGVRVERFDGLIAEAVRRAGITDAALAGVARERVIEALAARAGAPRVGRVPAALGELFAELQVRRIAPEAFTGALARWRAADGRSAAARGARHACTRSTARRSRGCGRPDGEQRAVRALDAPAHTAARVGRHARAVLRLRRPHAAAARRDRDAGAGRRCAGHGVARLRARQDRVRRARGHLPGARPARASSIAASPRAPTTTRRRSRSALAHLERTLFEPAPRARTRRARCACSRAAANAPSSSWSPTRSRALIDDGMAPGEIAVLVRSGGASLDLLEEVLAAARVPFATRRRRRFADTAIGRALLGALRCVPAARGLGRGRARGPARVAARAGPARRSRGAGRRARPRRRLEPAPGAPACVRGSGRGQLWEQRNWPLERARPRSPRRRSAARARSSTRAGRELERLFGAPRRRQARLLERRASSTRRGRSQPGAPRSPSCASWPAAIARSRRLGVGARARARASGGLQRRRRGRLRRRRGRGARPARAARAARAGPVRLRPAGGRVPARARVPSRSFRRRSAGAWRRSRACGSARHEDTLAAERYLLYAAVSRPEERLTLSWHVADDDGEAVARSLFVDDVATSSTSASRTAVGAERSARSTRRAPARTGSAASRRRARAAGGRLRDERAARDARASACGRRPRSSVGSAARCAGTSSGCSPPTRSSRDPEPLARGEPRARRAARRARWPARADGQRARDAASALRRARAARAGARGQRARPARSRSPPSDSRLRAGACAPISSATCATALPRRSPLEPRELELGFGFGDEEEAQEPGERAPLPALDLGEGLLLRGRIDRVDVSEDGEAVVYDYKGGNAPPSARWIARREPAGGALHARRASSCWACTRRVASTSRCPARTCARAACSTATAGSSSTACARDVRDSAELASCSSRCARPRIAPPQRLPAASSSRDRPRCAFRAGLHVSRDLPLRAMSARGAAPAAEEPL